MKRRSQWHQTAFDQQRIAVRGGEEIGRRRIAAPMIGEMVTAPLLSMLIVPAAWLLLRRCGGQEGKMFNTALRVV